MQKFNTILSCLILTFLVGCASSGKKQGEDGKTSTATTESAKKDSKTMDKKSAATSSAETTASSKCSIPNDDRTISVTKVGDGCAVLYMKNGQENEVATGRYGSEHCQGVKDKMVQNLTNAGFTCN